MKLAICTCIKNEHKFLEEWIDYHLSLGVDTIFLFEDFFSDSHTDICNKFKDKVVLQKVEDILQKDPATDVLDGLNVQIEINNWFIKHYKDIYDWCAFIDVDEFIVIEEDSIKNILLEFSNETGLTLSWKWYNANGIIHNDYKSVLDTFKTSYINNSYDSAWQWKSIVNMKNGGISYRIHFCPEAVNIFHNKTKIGKDNFNIHQRAWINHYFTKSWEDWCDRIFKRGSIVRNGHRTLDEFFIHNPDMLNMKDELYASIEGMIPNGTGFYNKRKRILCGGNINRIKRLNDKYDGHKTII